MRDLFDIARIQLDKEIDIGKREDYTTLNIVNYAIKIRKWLNRHQINKSEKLPFEKNILNYRRS